MVTRSDLSNEAADRRRNNDEQSLGAEVATWLFKIAVHQWRYTILLLALGYTFTASGDYFVLALLGCILWTGLVIVWPAVNRHKRRRAAFATYPSDLRPLAKIIVDGWTRAGHAEQAGLTMDLGVDKDGHRVIKTPALVAHGPMPVGIAIHVRPLPGQTQDELIKAAPRLATVWDQPNVVATPLPDSNNVRFTIVLVDPFATSMTYPLFDQMHNITYPLDAVPIGVGEDGGPVYHPLLGAHTCLVGVSGSGKGSVVGSLLCGVGWRDDVEVYGIDLKGGVEYAMSEHLFTRVAYTMEDAVTVLENAVERMQQRLEYMRATHSRKHTPTPEEPFIWVVIDEAASLVYYGERDQIKRADSALRLLLSQGRAAAVSVFAALQDPRKEALQTRDLFTRVIALRLKSASETIMALGQDAHDNGALCEAISPYRPGVGYTIAQEDGDPTPRQFRAYWVSDEMLQAIGAPPSPPPPPAAG